MTNSRVEKHQRERARGGGPACLRSASMFSFPCLWKRDCLEMLTGSVHKHIVGNRAEVVLTSVRADKTDGSLHKRTCRDAEDQSEEFCFCNGDPRGCVEERRDRLIGGRIERSGTDRCVNQSLQHRKTIALGLVATCLSLALSPDPRMSSCCL